MNNPAYSRDEIDEYIADQDRLRIRRARACVPVTREEFILGIKMLEERLSVKPGVAQALRNLWGIHE